MVSENYRCAKQSLKAKHCSQSVQALTACADSQKESARLLARAKRGASAVGRRLLRLYFVKLLSSFVGQPDRFATGASCDGCITGRFGGSEFRRGADFVAQQKMLPCATNDAVLRNKGVGGCARRLEGHRKLQGKKCTPLV